MITADSILDDFWADLGSHEAATPRAQQVEIGASQIYGCTAENIFRLRKHDSTERLVWQSVVGKAIHDYAATARFHVREGVIIEQRFTFRDVTATVDYIDPAQRLLIDLKTLDEAVDITDMARKGAKPEWIAQVQLGAAAAIEAGHPVEQVAILLLPRDGDLSDAKVLGPWDYDEQAAIDAAKWASDVEAMAADPDVDPRDHRGKPYFWCREFCPFVSQCRGEQEAVELADEYAVPALAYREAQDERDSADARMKALRPILLGRSGKTADGIQVISSAGSSKEVDELDTDELIEAWRFLHDDEPPPTKTVTKTTSPKLTVKWIKGGRK